MQSGIPVDNRKIYYLTKIEIYFQYIKEGMNALDIILLILLVPSAVRGLVKGFLTQAFELIALVLGAWAAYRFSWAATDWAEGYIQASPALLHVLLFVLILVVVFYLLNFLGTALRKIVRIVLPGMADKLLGLLFGLLKAGLGVGLLVILFHTLNARFGFVSADVLEGSVLYGPLKDLTYSVFPYFKELITL